MIKIKQLVNFTPFNYILLRHKRHGNELVMSVIYRHAKERLFERQKKNILTIE